MNPLILNVLNSIPAAASRFGGTVLKQAPKVAPKATQAVRGGFDPLNQVPALFSRFGGSVVGGPSVKNVQSLRGIVPTASLGMGGLSAAALDPMLQGSQYIQQQLKSFGLMAEPGRRIGTIPPKDKTGESYRDAELRLSAAARAAGGPSAGGGIGGGNAASSLIGGGFRPIGGAPEERALASETLRVAQLTAQDPELQRYENARKAAKTQEEMNAARDIGMQIWQQKYGNTPMGQPGGAIGMRNPLMDRTFGYQTGGAPDQQMGAPTLGPSPLVPQVDQSLNPASPNYIGGEGAPLMDFTRDEVTPELIAAYQKQLLEQAAAGRK